MQITPALVALLALAAAGCATPRADREWLPYLANTAHVEELPDGRTAVYPVSDWTYESNGRVTERYRDVVIDPDQLHMVWFLVEPSGHRLIDHTLLLFELEGDRLIGVTVEARREVDESFSALRGIWNAYELAYLWGTAQDLLTRRVITLDNEVFVYPLALADAQARDLLASMLERTARLEAEPRFYNSIASNCTSELAKAAGLDWSLSYVFTGAADNHLFRLGIIRGASEGLSFETATERADVTELVRELHAQGDDSLGFDTALLGELRSRWGDGPPPAPLAHTADGGEGRPELRQNSNRTPALNLAPNVSK